MTRTRCAAILAAALAAGCTGAEMAETVETTADDVLVYECKTTGGAPYHTVRVYKHDPYRPDEAGEARDAEAAAAQAAAAEVGEETVQITLNEQRPTNGVCGPAVIEGAYGCANEGRSLRLTWPAAGEPAVGAEAAVKVEEDWLFGTKTFSAQCARKA